MRGLAGDDVGWFSERVTTKAGGRDTAWGDLAGNRDGGFQWAGLRSLMPCMLFKPTTIRSTFLVPPFTKLPTGHEDPKAPPSLH